MTTTLAPSPTELRHRLLFILHRGWVEARMLAQGERHQQLYELADALEILPGCLETLDPETLDIIREELTRYETKYRPSCFEYTPLFADYDVPEAF